MAPRAQLAQLVEHFHGKEGVIGSSPMLGSRRDPTATARVKSVYSGKKKVTSMSLVKEGGRWKVAAF